MSVSRGDIVKVVLDVVPETLDGERYSRVFVRGIYEENAPEPERMPGATRNVVSAFLGLNMDVPALRIACGPETFWSAAKGEAPGSARVPDFSRAQLRSVACPKCGAGAGELCVTTGSRKGYPSLAQSTVHAARRRKAAELLAEDEHHG